MKQYTVKRDGERDIKFTGEQIAAASSSDNNASGSYSGSPGRWTELSLYRTQAGKYICEQIGRTCWEGEKDRFSAEVCETVDQVVEFFGHGWLAKELYEDADIDAAEEIE